MSIFFPRQEHPSILTSVKQLFPSEGQTFVHKMREFGYFLEPQGSPYLNAEPGDVPLVATLSGLRDGVDLAGVGIPAFESNSCTVLSYLFKKIF